MKPIWTAVLTLALATAVRAADTFVYTVTTTTGTPETVTVRRDNLIRATDDVILGRSDAALLAGRDVVATLNYAGAPNALRITLPADRSSATITYPRSGGPVNAFTGSTSFNVSPTRDVDNQVYYNITDNHNRQWEDLQRTLNHESYVMPADGNPSSATAFLAQQTFDKYGKFHDETPPGGSSRDWVRTSAGWGYGRSSDPYSPVIWLDTEGDGIRATGLSGYDFRFSLNAAGKFNPVLGYSISLPYQHREIEGSQSDTGGIEFGLPVEIVRFSDRVPVSWTITPFVGFAVDDAQDLGSTVGIFQGGVATRVAVRFGRSRQWVASIGTQYSGFAGFDLGNGYDDYDYGNDGGPFRGHAGNQLLKNGVTLSRRVGGGVSIDGSVVYSAYLQNAATDQWWSPALGVAWQISPRFALRWQLQADLANHYQSVGGQFQFAFRY